MPIYAIAEFIKSHTLVRVVFTKQQFYIKGYIIGFDQYFNLTMDNAVLVNQSCEKNIHRIVLRGENIAFIRDEQ